MYEIFHYKKNNFNDVGFGCSYRNIQTIISALKLFYFNTLIVPDIEELLKEIKPGYKDIIATSNIKSLWIEPHDIYDYFYKHLGMRGNRILYCVSMFDIKKMLNERDISKYEVFLHKIRFDKVLQIFVNHFKESKLPIVIDDGVYSYLISEIYKCKKKFVLIDPHTFDKNSAVTVKDIDFLKNSFWMIYVPDCNTVKTYSS